MTRKEVEVNIETGSEIFVHIGFHKTGTTFLQRKIFPNLKNVNYVHNGKLLNLVGSYGKVLISNEAFSGIPYHWNEKRYYEQFCSNIARLKSIFGNFKVIVGFREPSSMVNSFYKQFLHEGGVLTFEEFFGNHPEAVIQDEDLYFSRFYNHLRKNFDEEQLFCYDHSQLLYEPLRVISALLQFLGQKISASLHGYTSEKLNVSVPDNLEGFLLHSNKWDNKLKAKFGIGLNNKYTKKFKITPRSLAQYTLPKILGRKKQRDLKGIKDAYAEDWAILNHQIHIR